MKINNIRDEFKFTVNLTNIFIQSVSGVYSNMVSHIAKEVLLCGDG